MLDYRYLFDSFFPSFIRHSHTTSEEEKITPCNLDRITLPPILEKAKICYPLQVDGPKGPQLVALLCCRGYRGVVRDQWTPQLPLGDSSRSTDLPHHHPVAFTASQCHPLGVNSFWALSPGGDDISFPLVIPRGPLVPHYPPITSTASQCH